MEKSASPSCTYQYLYCDNRHWDRASEGSTLAEVPCPLAGADGGIAAPSLAAASQSYGHGREDARGPRPDAALYVRTTDGCAIEFLIFSIGVLAWPACSSPQIDRCDVNQTALPAWLMQAKRIAGRLNDVKCGSATSSSWLPPPSFFGGGCICVSGGDSGQTSTSSTSCSCSFY